MGELAASIAHEVNQPLAAISAYGQASLRWLAKPEPDLAELALLSAMMVEDAKRASDIIARIRSMAVNRRAKRTPYRRPKGTPLRSGMTGMTDAAFALVAA